MYEIQTSTQFRRDIKKCLRQRKDFQKFKIISELLENGNSLPLKNKDHRECHIEPDWLLIYRKNEEEKTIEFVRIGSHSELFG